MAKNLLQKVDFLLSHSVSPLPPRSEYELAEHEIEGEAVAYGKEKNETKSFSSLPVLPRALSTPRYGFERESTDEAGLSSQHGNRPCEQRTNCFLKTKYHYD